MECFIASNLVKQKCVRYDALASHQSTFYKHKITLAFISEYYHLQKEHNASISHKSWEWIKWQHGDIGTKMQFPHFCLEQLLVPHQYKTRWRKGPSCLVLCLPFGQDWSQKDSKVQFLCACAQKWRPVFCSSMIICLQTSRIQLVQDILHFQSSCPDNPKKIMEYLKVTVRNLSCHQLDGKSNPISFITRRT